MSEENALTAVVDFDCVEEDCVKTIQFDLLKLQDAKGQIACPNCRRLYQFDKDFLRKLEKLRKLVLAVRDAEDILGNCNVSVTTPTGEVKIPYRLLLTRLNTNVTLDIGNRTIDFNFRVEPLNGAQFK